MSLENAQLHIVKCPPISLMVRDIRRLKEYINARWDILHEVD